MSYHIDLLHYVIVRFFGDDMNILIVHFNKTSFDNVSCDEKDLKTIIHVTYMAFHNRLKQRKAFKNKIFKQLMLVAWHPKIW